MSDESATFLDLCLAGKARLDQIDDFVDAWHEGEDPRELSDYLGMSREEFADWVERPDTLEQMLLARKHSATTS